MAFNGTALLVDDEPHIRKFIGLLLKQLGEPTVIEAGNGEEAIEIYQHKHPDLVLLDVNMPIMDGIETLRKLMEIDPACTVVMLTSMTNRQTVDDAAKLGATNYLRKDARKEEIIESLQAIVEARFPIE
mgnify:CR=1 FL=1